MKSTLARSARVDGSWLCKNAEDAQSREEEIIRQDLWSPNLQSEFNLEVELKNIILVAFQFTRFYAASVKNGSRGLCGGLSALPR
jgi:hypothetical protein